MPSEPKKIYTSADYRAPITTISRQGYISYDVRPIGYKNSLERYVLVTCRAPGCNKIWDIKASLVTSTGNQRRHLEKEHPDWLPSRATTTTSSNQSITSFTTSQNTSSLLVKDGIDRRIIIFLTQNTVSIRAISSKSFKDIINFERT